jgi:hypothetical protein
MVKRGENWSHLPKLKDYGMRKYDREGGWNQKIRQGKI